MKLRPPMGRTSTLVIWSVLSVVPACTERAGSEFQDTLSSTPTDDENASTDDLDGGSLDGNVDGAATTAGCTDDCSNFLGCDDIPEDDGWSCDFWNQECIPGEKR